MPDMRKFLPAPPDTIGNKFSRDIMRYMWGKTMRLDEERADIAKRDAVYGVDCICEEFSEPFGLQLSQEGTPEIYKLLVDATSTSDSICYEPKKFYMRKRPFMRMQAKVSQSSSLRTTVRCARRSLSTLNSRRNVQSRRETQR